MSTQPEPESILGVEDRALLRRLDLVHRRAARGLYPGQRRSPRTARSPELADFRPYSPGDDIRQIDWRAFGRLEKLMLRLYVAEEEGNLNVVVDTSESMTLGIPPKWTAARRLAAALCMLGLKTLDRVAVGALDPSKGWTPHLRLSGGGPRVLGFLTRLETGGSAGPGDLAKLGWVRPGLTVLISDFLSEDDWGRPIAVLGGSQHDVVLWQVLAPEEEHPHLSGDVGLVEVESGRRREITVTSRVLRDYARALEDLRRRLQEEAAALGGRFLNTRSDEDLEASMLTALRAGVVRRV